MLTTSSPGHASTSSSKTCLSVKHLQFADPGIRILLVSLASCSGLRTCCCSVYVMCRVKRNGALDPRHCIVEGGGGT